MKLSILLAVFAEEEVVAELVKQLADLLGEEIFEIIILISPKSPQKTKDICSRLENEYPFLKVHVQREYPGNGLAFREGFSMAEGDYILMMDGDGEMDPHTVPELVRKIEETGADMVVASRWAPGGGAEGYDPLKYFLNRGFQVIFGVLFRTKIHDLTLGFKLMKKEVAKGIIWEAPFQDIGEETTVKPLRAGFRVEEVPTVWKKRGAGSSTNNFTRNFRYVKLALEVLGTKPEKLLKKGDIS
ncbi:MAG: glycosyltransferase [Candidatus Eremiobacteraeota bacterium]|nr:glycosyltransferase [Candidatus Eremiobacteraeota bacterium]